MAGVSLTAKQAASLRFIAGFIRAHGYGPSFRQIQQGMGFGSVSSTSLMVGGLVDRAKVRRLPNRCRAIEVLEQPAIPLAPDGAPLFVVPKVWRRGGWVFSEARP